MFSYLCHKTGTVINAIMVVGSYFKLKIWFEVLIFFFCFVRFERPVQPFIIIFVLLMAVRRRQTTERILRIGIME
jgi:hypothetical protein